ncbi:MAG: hypothetical protein OEZ51_08445 [Nitrospinota bacterium]|nr:hypothetical protein [Nitrospinota bacterium]
MNNCFYRRKIVPCVFAILFLWANPLWAAEEGSETPAQQEESVFDSIKRKSQEWFGGDDKAAKAGEETQKPSEPSNKSDGRKAIDTIKHRMKKASDNVSESVDRDKKTLKKKLDKLSNDK